MIFKITRVSLLVFIAFFSQINAFSQSVTLNASATNLPCGGGPIQLDAVGMTSSTVFGDDFNSGVLTTGWSTGASATFTNPCGPSFDGTTYLWMGSATSAPRQLITAGMDVSCGGTVCFDFKFMCEYCGDSSPCEGADFYNEGVSLQYSLNGGTSWIDIAYFAPNGNLLTSYPGSGTSSPIAFGATNFTTWANYCFPIPVGGFSTNTEFRLFQWGASGTNYDHWGIDNFEITTIPCNPFYYDWSHLPGFPDAASITTNVTTTTTFTVDYTDGTTTYTDQVTIVVDNAEVDTVIVTEETCIGDNNASIITTMANGTPPYTYTLTGTGIPSNITGSFSNLSPGLYIMNVLDDDNCVTNYNFTISNGPSCCVVSTTPFSPLCNGQTNGYIVAYPSGGIPPYAYQWYDAFGAPIAGETNQTLNNIGAGSYSVEITDASGCINQDFLILSEPSPLNGILTSSQIDCFGDCNGIIEFDNISGGILPYTYTINGGASQSSNIFNSLCQGNYTVSLIDSNNCQFSLMSVITEPTNLVLSNTLVSNEICDQSNGSIAMAATGGTPGAGYTYNIGLSSNTTGVFNNLDSLDYIVYVTDDNNCQDSISVFVPHSLKPNPVLDYQQDVLCAGGINGAVVIVVSISTGTAPFTYDLNYTGPVLSNAFNVNAGNHTVIVADANNCTDSVSFSISQPTPLSFTYTKTDALCFGACDGTVTVNASGATPPYTYSSNNGLSFQTSNVLDALCAGVVHVVVKDANGCLSNTSDTIYEPLPVLSSFTSVNPTCYNGCDASITFGVTTGGNNGPYTYSIDNGVTFQVSPFFINLCEGNYTLIAKDGNNCEFLMSASLINPAQITFNDISNTSSNCGFSNGALEVQAINGTIPYSYTINNWVTNQLTGNFTNLNSGLYWIIVEDGNNCIDSTQESIGDVELVTALDSTHNITCYGGTDGGVFVSIVNGAPPITFTLDSVYFQTVGSFDGMVDPNVLLPAGTHFVIVNDNGSCQDFYEFILTQPDSIMYTPAITASSCIGTNDGTISINNVTGGDNGPYQYSIDSGATFQNSNLFIGLATGVYNTRVMDGNGCFSDLQVTLSLPTNISVSLNPTDLVCHGDNTGAMIVLAQGGLGPYNYNIGPANNSNGIFVGLNAGLFNIQITDANGCIKDTTLTLIEPDTITANFVIQDIMCFGECDGEIDINALGGTPPLLYSADGGISQQSSDTLDLLCVGNYSVQIEDYHNCTYTVNQIVSEPNDISTVLVPTIATCNLNNASITVNSIGGTGIFNYSLSDNNGATYTVPSINNIFNNLGPGNYIIKINDANGCEDYESTDILADPIPTIDFIATTNILCNGGNNGSITITSGQGIGIHEYSLDNIFFFPTNIFNNLTAGVYNVFVRDGNGCIAQSQTTIIEPTPLVNNTITTNLICNNDFSGSINMLPTGGTTSYTYSIDNGTTFQPINSFNNLSANFFTTIVMDANGCTDVINTQIFEPASITTTPILVGVTCFGDCDGSIDLQPNGGTGILSYQWTANIANAVSSTATNICGGIYDAIITDANGCVYQELGMLINEPPQIVINNVITSNDTCYNACGGSIQINSPTAISYELISTSGSTVSVNSLFENLCDGFYDIEVTDNIGCQATSTTSITEPDTLIGSAPSDWTNICNGTDINVSAGYTSGGTQPYSFNWTDLFANNYPLTNTFTVNVTQNNTYTFNIVDANGCTAGQYSYNITVSDPLLTNFAAGLDVNICPGESTDLTIIPTDGQQVDLGSSLGYFYSWDTGNPNDTLSTITVSPTITTDYTVAVSDYCQDTVYKTITVNVFDDPNPIIAGYASECSPHISYITNENQISGAIISNEWIFSNGLIYNTPGPIEVPFTTPGCYDVTSNVSYTYPTGDICTGSAFAYNIICVNPLPVSNFEFTPNAPLLSDQSIQFINKSEGETFYDWQFGSYGNSNNESPTFTYTFEEETVLNTCLTVTSDSGCVNSTCQIIVIQEDLLFYVPNAFTPSNGDLNSNFLPQFTSGFNPYKYELSIYNRWGETVFISNNHEIGWDGKYNNLDSEQAVYVWQISYFDTFEGKYKIVRGHVTLLR